MVIAQKDAIRPAVNLTITWEKLPRGFQLEEKPVENTGQPLLAGALRESLEIIRCIQPEELIASNLGICATINGELVIKAPDWFYVPKLESLPMPSDRKSYTPHLEGDIPSVVMEFLSDTDGEEYSVKRTYPPGKWFFYEQILQVPTYVIFSPETGLLEVYRLQNQRYELELPDYEGHHWLAEMELFLGVWRGEKAGRTGYWLRWWDKGRNLVPWGVEQLTQERQRAEQEHQRAEQERQRADKLAAYLRAQGINPDEIIVGPEF